jgi:hypothetical protein
MEVIAMKITDSNITMIGQSQYQETHQITETRNQITPAPMNPGTPIKLGMIDQLFISDDAWKALQESQGNQSVKVIQLGRFELQLHPMEKLKIQALDSSITAITDGTISIRLRVPLQPLTTKIQIERHETYRESEQMSFTAGGIIKTADGKEINFSTQLNMSREFAAENVTSITEEIQWKDPLVINFDGPAAQLTETKFSFDLDNDGILDQMSFLKSGSGFLALDKNQDGTINNGGELFGTASGNGFADLLQYDLDKNGWIDESDSIYEKLRIWTKDENGQDVLFALGQKGVGAIYLGNVDTQFSYKDAANQTEGQLRKTGIFLREDGTAGTVQQIDLVV